jgi:hypothetical protein
MFLLFGFYYENHFKSLYCNKIMKCENSVIFSILNRIRIGSYYQFYKSLLLNVYQ